MALSIVSQSIGPERTNGARIIAFALQMALEGDIQFVDEEDFDMIIEGGTDSMIQHVYSLEEDEKMDLITDLNILLEAAFS